MINIYKIYCIINNLNNKKYIGITSRNIQERFIEHCSSSKTLLHDDIIAFGKDNFKLELVEDNISEKEKDDKERYYIEIYNTLFPFGYNKSTGGICGKDLNEISRKLLSIKGTGINNSKCDKYILQIDPKTNQIINKFGSAREAGRFLGNENKYKSISNCLSGKTKLSLGFIWKYEE